MAAGEVTYRKQLFREAPGDTQAGCEPAMCQSQQGRECNEGLGKIGDLSMCSALVRPHL